ncbi:MAG: Orotidine 5'-phosphate decarboxylase [Candidatus Gottesmanbacteria bacterium GW2011_GWC2_39_8]|uniref:Orotidine 5'-phosphate decarboxylase n=1 Tax=Candidatus Gottesmanbacteria bacterium GW2011_GWC2_39_8 TaxID=1618450 RepID=A0A0G0SH51_9BACT|nr:MAG: Orotidine 5'-phosphate decarboxylase [Candidatus Gottesmanbacteria bacterium GW2011_GWC2_39_8]
MTFKEKLRKAAEKNNSLLCVGLDTDLNKIPEHIKTDPNPLFVFNKAIIEATNQSVSCYKPNSAFYEAYGAEGIGQLKLTMDYLKEKYPDIPVILDAKRGDIGNTNEGYIKYAYDYLGVDAITLHPYLGKEAIKPFLDRKDQCPIILCKTSNPGAGELQDLVPDPGDQSIKLYQLVAEKVVKEWNYNGNCGLVVGATYPEELSVVRGIAKDLPLLLPGIGAQGGDVEKTVKAGVDAEGFNAIINSGRNIIYASSDLNFSIKAGEVALETQNLINIYRENIIKKLNN